MTKECGGIVGGDSINDRKTEWDCCCIIKEGVPVLTHPHTNKQNKHNGIDITSLSVDIVTEALSYRNILYIMLSEYSTEKISQ